MFELILNVIYFVDRATR